MQYEFTKSYFFFIMILFILPFVFVWPPLVLHPVKADHTQLKPSEG